MVKARAHRRFISTDLSLSALLVVLVLLIFVFYPLGDVGPVGGAITELLFAVMLVSGVATISASRTGVMLMCTIALGALISGWLAFMYPSFVVSIVKFSLTSIFLTALVGIVLVEVFREGEITSHRIQGAIAAYLLLGVLWAMLFRLVAVLIPGAFQTVPGFFRDSTENVLTREHIFFSFGSLTTLGYPGMIATHLCRCHSPCWKH